MQSLYRQQKTESGKWNLKCAKRERFCRHVRAEDLVNNAQFSKLDPFTQSTLMWTEKTTCWGVKVIGESDSAGN